MCKDIEKKEISNENINEDELKLLKSFESIPIKKLSEEEFINWLDEDY